MSQAIEMENPYSLTSNVLGIQQRQRPIDRRFPTNEWGQHGSDTNTDDILGGWVTMATNKHSINDI